MDSYVGGPRSFPADTYVTHWWRREGHPTKIAP